ncbi:hypothetical protein BVRB_015670 [Beta vulgaris subsp. vulgaris]|uniref:Uncharacterized protein n=1 Tax=Beta vulgaris subsp. vulgaris TaxID=3555 RepID=A0A0J8B164_BETVV|nr:hypothetical protein BVRB_015670 [Beta vulgaris subsp. vulgaris]
MAEDDEEDEDVKIEKFFALIRSAKDISDQLFDAEGSKHRVKKAVTTEKKKSEVAVKTVKNDNNFTEVDVKQVVAADSTVADSAKISRSSPEENSNKAAADYNSNNNNSN